MGFSANASFGNGGFGFSVGIGTQTGPIAGQTFRNIAVPNFQPAIYQLAIRAPQPPYALISSYTFPISPEAVRKENAAMSNAFQVAGTPSQGGVERIIDTYGNSPPDFIIEGTTGWQYHGTDGYAMTGLQSIIALQNFLAYFAQLNQLQVQNRIPDLYILEFYDYFSNDYWQVVPIGKQGIRRTVQRPLLAQYAFRFAGVRPLSGPIFPFINDPIGVAFSIGGAQGSINLQAQLNGFISAYAAVSF